MRRRRTAGTNAPWTLFWFAVVFQTLRPFEPIDRAVNSAAAPLRVVSELAAPAAILRKASVSAADRALQEEEETRRLLEALAASSRPTEERVLAGRRLVHAEVVGHSDRDHLRVRLRDPRGVEPGMPVACGDAYVGRVIEVAARRPDAANAPRDMALVELVTAADFHVGAIVENPIRVESTSTDPAFEQTVDSAPILMTVGGVHARTRRRDHALSEVHLAVHNPSDRSLESGLARVHELFAAEERYADLAEGLRLGSVTRSDDGFRIVPEVDYVDGLFEVVVLCPPDPEYGSALPFEPVLRDANWIRSRPMTGGDASPFRSSCKIRAGSDEGVGVGAAVTSIGAHLIGRVIHAGELSSDVAFLDDPAFSVVAVAKFASEETPRVLGRLVSMGRSSATGAVRFRWIVRVSLGVDAVDDSGFARARLYTGSGDVGLPAGFSFGEARIPIDAEPGEERVIEVETEIEPRLVRSLFVRTGFRERGEA